MTNLIIRLFGYDQSRIVLTRTYDGQHWYKAEPICSLLGVDNQSYYVKKYLRQSEYRKETEWTGTSRRQLLMINERGLYKLIQAIKTEKADEVRELAKAITAPLRPASWPEEQLAA